MRRSPPLALTLLLPILPALSSCYDLDVAAPPELTRDAALGDAAAVVALVAGSFQDVHTAVHGYFGPGMMLSGVSFQHVSPHECRMPYGGIPRPAVENPAECGEGTFRVWADLYGVLAATADGVRALKEDRALREELGLPETERLMAVARLVQGVAHGSLALLFDRGAVLDETTLGAADQELLAYPELMEVALGYLAQAVAHASGPAWAPTPAEWMTVEVGPEQLVRVARSYAARYRASAARTPEERAAVDWAAVMADAEAGVTEDWVLLMDPMTRWLNGGVYYSTRPGHGNASYHILGMADQSGSYGAWLAAPLLERRPVLDGRDILVVTPDTRFPRGATVEEQHTDEDAIFAIPTRDLWGVDIRDLWVRANTGTWRWSYYLYVGGWAYLELTDPHWPELAEAELRLLRAEGLLRQGDTGGAATLVNVSRAAHGLAPTDAAGTNTDCVPRLPDGRCGGLMEMLKWEKRLETIHRGAFGASWYFDGRGWGDLLAGTFLQLPVPCPELVKLGEACYTYGGSGAVWSAPESVYHWPEERGS